MIQTAKELATAAENVAKYFRTLYVMGCFGAPMNSKNKDRYCRNHSYNRQTERTVKIKAATSDTFGFDCVCLIKGLLWGWNGDDGKTYGGAVYKSGGVPDIGADQMMAACSDLSTDFSSIQPGEAVGMNGHIGIYIGDGLAVECTPAWEDGVQITAVHNIGKKAGYNGRTWARHGKLPYVTYEKPVTVPSYTLELPQLYKGCKGEPVRALQAILIERGYSCGSSGVDGSFGPATDKAVKAFQRDCELDADGYVGHDTMGALMGL